jgi:hypothetical protein
MEHPQTLPTHADATVGLLDDAIVTGGEAHVLPVAPLTDAVSADRLRPARGLVIGAALSVVFWLVLGVLVWIALR